MQFPCKFHSLAHKWRAANLIGFNSLTTMREIAMLEDCSSKTCNLIKSSCQYFRICITLQQCFSIYAELTPNFPWLTNILIWVCLRLMAWAKQTFHLVKYKKKLFRREKKINFHIKTETLRFMRIYYSMSFDLFWFAGKVSHRTAGMRCCYCR